MYSMYTVGTKNAASYADAHCDRAGGRLAGVQQVPGALLLHRLPLLPLPHAGVPGAGGGRAEEVLLLRQVLKSNHLSIFIQIYNNKNCIS